jgi:DNA-binding NarL/FixJ family response regulator
MQGCVRILIAEEQAVVREGLRRLLECEEGFAVVGVADRPAQAALLLAETTPDLVLMGIGASAEPTLVTLRNLQAMAPGMRVLLMGETTVPVSDILLAGARGILRADSRPDELFKAIRTVAAGQYWVGRGAFGEVVEFLRSQASRGTNGARDSTGLTARERQVAIGASRGESNREIAARLGLSEGTIKDHLTAIFHRLDLANRAELSAWVTLRGLEDKPPRGSDDPV